MPDSSPGKGEAQAEPSHRRGDFRTPFDAAKQYAELGLRVLPVHGVVEGRCSCSAGVNCNKPGKHPWIRAWTKDATTDPATIEAWWAAYPHANVGIATGGSSGIIVIDVDPPNGGDQTLKDLEAKHGPLPKTVRARTGGGGQHIYLRHPGFDVKSTPHGLGNGVDVRADGAQVVAPPSVHASGGRYEWESSAGLGEVEIAECPATWLPLLPRPGAKQRAISQPQGQPPANTPPSSSTRVVPIQLMSDDKLLYAAKNAKNGSEFDALWTGGLCGHPSRSEGDLALCGLLAFWTRKNAAQMDRLFRRSGRMRPKWDEPHTSAGQTYGAMTVEKAIEGCREVFGGRRSSVADGKAAPTEEDHAARSKLEDARASLEQLTAGTPAEVLDKAFKPETVDFLAVLRDNDAAEFEQVMLRIRAAGVTAASVKRLSGAVYDRMQKIRREAKKQRTEARQRASAPSKAAKIRDALPDAPVPADAIEPGGWTVNKCGVAKMNFDDNERPIYEPITASPVVISRRLVDVQSGAERVELAFVRDGKWRKVLAKRSVAATTREIVTLADDGFPVHSNNSADLVQYLADFEAANAAVISIDYVSSQLGWCGSGFLCGSTYLTAADTSGGASRKTVLFCGDDVGDDQRAQGLRGCGTLEGWIAAAKLASSYPRAAIVLYASFVPPLLEILDVRNFFVDLCGQSSTGKTICLRLGASIWGDPDERKPGAFLQTWDSTAVFIERTCSVLNSMPLLLDDTRQVEDASMIEAVIYRVASGQGRGRGSVKGTQKTLTFSTVLISSGEEPATGFAREGGAHARAITLWGMPFGAANNQTAGVVAAINSGVRVNYGHAGPAFVRFLLRIRRRWDAIRDYFRRRVIPIYQRLAGPCPVMGRCLEYFAAIHVAGKLAHVALNLPWRFSNPVVQLWQEIVSSLDRVDQPAAALRLVQSWAVAHEGEFVDRGMHSQPPSAGWAGRWPNKLDWEFIAILPHRLKNILAEGGHQLDATVRAWRDRGWLGTAPGRLQKRIVLKNERPWAFAITRAAFDDV